jgi:hypothetical protein
VRSAAVRRSVRQRVWAGRGAGSGNPWPAGCASNGAEDWGRYKEKVDRLEDEVYGRRRERRALVVSWWQLIAGGLFVLAGSFGGAALVLVLGP